MPRQCIFCPNPADSREHLWPNWVLESIDKPIPSVRKRSGNSFVDFEGAVKVKYVCTNCNGGWMNDLEKAVRHYMGPMLHGVSINLAREQQELITAWIVKTAMVLEATEPKRPPFYTQDERDAMRLRSAVPVRSLVWLGRFAGSQLLADAIDIKLNVDGVPKVADGYIATFIMGQFLAQILTAHYPFHYNNKPMRIHLLDGPWDRTLVDIWPTRISADWPPSLAFSKSGFPFYSSLLDRWKMGRAMQVR